MEAQMHQHGMIRRWILFLAVLLISGCNSESTTSPGTGLEVTNAADDFQYQVTNVRNYTHQDTFVWQNTGDAANVNQATTISSGSVTLTLLDADGTQVYTRSLAENGTFESATGVSGSWTIRLTYSRADATVNFRVQKRP
jgi:hypothetical protein